MTDDVIILADGTKKTRSSIVNEAITFYKEQYDENLTNICDFSEGSEIRTLHESFGVELFDFYRFTYAMFQQTQINTATGAYLDEKGCEFHLNRKPSEVATGTVTFTLADTLSINYTIPAGTVILGRGTGYEYILQSNVVIAAGTLSADGIVYSKLTGARYNALADSLTAFKNIENIRTEVKVTNANEITGGVDAETDEEFRRRILAVNRQRTWGTIPVYEQLITEEVNDVHDVQFASPTLSTIPAHYKSDGKTKCTDCDKIIFVNANSKPCPTSVLNQVEYVMNQQNNLVIGHNFHIQAASVKKVYLAIHLYVESLVDEDVLADHISTFIDGGLITTKEGETQYTGIPIRGVLYKNKLIDCIERVPGVSQVESIHRMYYNPSPCSASGWVQSGSTTYNYTDDNGYTYTKDSNGTINPWGEKNFDTIELSSGYVIELGQMKDLDSTTTKIINLTQTVVE